MTKIEELNRKMLAIEKQGHLTEQEYATYKQLLEAAALMQEACEHDTPISYVRKVEALLEELK